jgi:anthranilate 3-monooxygenase (FAD)/4-hydroxyphenylacetate 3-monooxygenase
MGTVRPSFSPLQTLRGMMSRAYPRIIEVLQTVGAGGLLMMPTAADFESDIGPDIEKYYQGADGLAAVDRVRLFKLAWDLAGDAFGSRAMQYERYYAGDPVRVVAGTYLGYVHKDECMRLVDNALALGGTPAARRPGSKQTRDIGDPAP